MRLSREDILHLADLARLELNEGEVQRAEAELSGILGYVERLAAIPTDEAEPYTQPKREMWRADIAEPCESIVRDGIIKNFPDKQGSLLKTPGVFAHPKS